MSNCVYKKPNGLWYVRFKHKGEKHTGGRGFKTYEEGNECHIKMLNELIEGTSIAKSNITISEFVALFLQKYLGPKLNDSLKDSSLKTIETNLRNHALSLIGNEKLQNSTIEKMNDLKNELLSRYAPNTVKNDLVQLSRVFNIAVLWEYLKVNPLKSIERPKAETKKPEIYEEEEFEYLIKNAPLRDKTIIAIMGMGGLRIGEVFGLLWENIDFKKGIIRIIWQSNYGKLRDPKTKYSNRTVPIAPELRPILLRWKLKCPSNKFVVPGKDGKKPLCEGPWRAHHYKPLLEKLKLKYVKPQGLRHQCTFMLLNRRIEIRDVSGILGHSSTDITYKIYDRLSPEHYVDEMKDISFFNKPGVRKKVRKQNGNSA
jgi:integrase